MMKVLKYSLLSLTILTLGFLFSEPVLAQVKVLATPEALTVTGTRGAVARETRTLTLRSTAPVTNLRIYAFDLYNTDRDRVFPKRLITLPSTIAQVNVDNLENFPVEFNLQEAPSGEFRGDVLISYQGNELSVPVIIRVKDPWYLPFALLVFGVILGTTVSSYSRWGRTTDEVTVGLESLRTQFESDKDIPPSFASRISTHLVDGKLARDTKQLEAAQQSITEARNLWSKWFRQRAEWLEALNVGTSLEEKLASLATQDFKTRYIQAIQRDLKDILLRVADFANPSEFGQQINCLSRQQAFCLRVYHQLVDFQKMLDDFKMNKLEPPDQEKLQNLKDNATNLKQQLSNLLPSDQPEQAELQVIETEINQAAEAFKALKNKVEDILLIDNLGEFKRGQDKSVRGETPATEPVTEVPVSPATKVPSLPTDENPVLKVISTLIPNPNRRLQLFSFAGYLTTITFLAGTGFNQLYLERSTFGADGLRDYFALLAWGFGAEATRSTVTNALRRTDESKP
ncbi:hypothetical protein H6G97_33025 [Nostoc flagelliforme FACHB-838]|uniref:Uncharacterized protein n=1 Tax=Nostoc flagelliforme FACHB-838 TaxID=2692904 RepID=A0ABR8DZ18_9NOSO|nr:hypothetical protein [Nostoc flagelliforme FACHB-838]